MRRRMGCRVRDWTWRGSRDEDASAFPASTGFASDYGRTFTLLERRWRVESFCCRKLSYSALAMLHGDHRLRRRVDSAQKQLRAVM